MRRERLKILTGWVDALLAEARQMGTALQDVVALIGRRDRGHAAAERRGDIMNGDWVVEIMGLSRRFGRKPALDGVDLRIPRGCVFGRVGENSAGKTMQTRHIRLG